MSNFLAPYWFMYGDEPRLDQTGEFLVIDTETTGLRWTDNIIGIALAWRVSGTGDLKSCYFSGSPRSPLFSDNIWSKERLNDLLVEIFDKKSVVGQYFSFDARVIFRDFGIVPRKSFDTWHMAKSLSFRSSYSLKNLAKDIGINDESWFNMKEVRGKLSKQNPVEVAEYARKDALYTMQVFDSLMGEYELLPNYQDDIDFTYLTYSIMARGFPLNEELLEKRLEDETSRYKELQTMFANKGLDNTNSPVKVMRFLKANSIFPENTSAEGLAPYAKYPLVEQLITAKQLQSNINSRLEVFRDYKKNGRLHSEWHPFGTASYRMVAKDPNLMAQPLKDRGERSYEPLAALFTNEKSYVLQLDIAQAEVRLAAMLSRCNGLAEILSKGGDVYMQMAQIAYGEANKENRQKAKRATLASIYEEGPSSFSQSHGVSMQEAMDVLDQFRRVFPEIKSMSNAYSEFAQKNGFINLYTGRKIHFDKQDNRLYRAFNQEVQGGLAEIMRTFMLAMDKEFPGRIIGQIHDSLILEFDRDDVSVEMIEEVKATAIRILNESLPENVKSLTTPEIPMILDCEAFVPIFNEEI